MTRTKDTTKESNKRSAPVVTLEAIEARDESKNNFDKLFLTDYATSKKQLAKYPFQEMLPEICSLIGTEDTSNLYNNMLARNFKEKYKEKQTHMAAY